MTQYPALTPSTNLIPVFTGQLNGLPTQLVDARALHSVLGSARQFGDWIKTRIAKYDFLENQDFALISQNYEIKEGRGGDRRSVDYHLSLGMAKELAMVENNAKGREVRRYFIAMEQAAQQAAQQALLPYAPRAVSAPEFTPMELEAIWEHAATLSGRLCITLRELITDQLRGWRYGGDPIAQQPIHEQFKDLPYFELIASGDLRTLCQYVAMQINHADAAIAIIHDLENSHGDRFYHRPDSSDIYNPDAFDDDEDGYKELEEALVQRVIRRVRRAA